MNARANAASDSYPDRAASSDTVAPLCNATAAVSIRHRATYRMGGSPTSSVNRAANALAAHGRTLFLVGDPMQSIYRFRQAEVRLFLRAQAEGAVGRIAVGVLGLAQNFRSQRNAVASPCSHCSRRRVFRTRMRTRPTGNRSA